MTMINMPEYASRRADVLAVLTLLFPGYEPQFVLRDIYLNNPRVTSGSATTNVPVIKTSSTLEFETTLNMPGDFYEFVVDVVNAGSIDAMIENVVKTPELTTEQAKYLKYEVSYANGESIENKQILYNNLKVIKPVTTTITIL